MQWTAWNFKIDSKAYYRVRPLSLEVRPEVELYIEGYLWWQKTYEQKTGRWEIKLVYDDGPMTKRKIDVIKFDREEDARYWYDHTYTSVFLGEVDAVTPKPAPAKPKQPEVKKPNKPGLKLV